MTATGIDRNQVSALTGLGWSHYFISQDYPACGSSHADAGVSYVYNLREAIHALDRVIALEAAGAYHYRTRAQLKYLLSSCQPTYDRQKQTRSAIDDYTLALRYAPEQAQWWYTRGNLLFLVGDYAEAAASYGKATGLQPKTWNFWNTLTKATLKLGPDHFDEASAAYAEAAKSIPNDPAIRYDAWWRLGWATYEAGDYALSVEVSGRAIALKPDEPRTLFNQGLAYLASGDTSATQSSYQAGIDAAKRLSEADRNSRLEEAVGDLRAIRADPAGAAQEFITLLEAAQGQAVASADSRTQ